MGALGLTAGGPVETFDYLEKGQICPNNPVARTARPEHQTTRA